MIWQNKVSCGGWEPLTSCALYSPAPHPCSVLGVGEGDVTLGGESASAPGAHPADDLVEQDAEGVDVSLLRATPDGALSLQAQELRGAPQTAPQRAPSTVRLFLPRCTWYIKQTCFNRNEQFTGIQLGLSTCESAFCFSDFERTLGKSPFCLTYLSLGRK